MYTISDETETQEYHNMQIKKIVKSSSLEILSITLEKEALFPDHTSPRDVELIVLEGSIEFHINGVTYNLTRQQHFNFPKGTKHRFLALKIPNF